MEEDSTHEKQPGEKVPLCSKLRAGEGDPACGQLLGIAHQLQQPGTALELPANPEVGSSGCQVTAGSHTVGDTGEGPY